MPLPRKQRAAPRGVSFNATPLIDVIFTLTIFFMLVTRFSSAEQVPMQLPQPQDSLAQVMRIPDRVVLNCRLADPAEPETAGALYSIGPNNPEPLSTISERLAGMKRQNPNLKAVIRADRRLPYEDVQALLRVVAHSGVEMLNVVAHVAEDR